MSEKPLTTGAVREMRGFLRAIGKYGYLAITPDETGICFYCGADTEFTKSPRHGPSAYTSVPRNYSPSIRLAMHEEDARAYRPSGNFNAEKCAAYLRWMGIDVSDEVEAAWREQEKDERKRRRAPQPRVEALLRALPQT